MATRFPSARHQAALSTPTGYRRRSRFTFSRGGQTVDLEPISGSITADARRNARWDGRLSFAGDDLIPQRPGDILTPFGTRVQIELGLELLDGSVSMVPYGTFEINKSQVKIDADQRTVEVTLIDISDRVERYRFETPLTVASGTDLGTMINTVITNRTGVNPGVPLVGSSLGAARVFGLDVATAPWAEILDVLSSFSRVAWYDRVGAIQVGNLVPDPASAYPLDSLTSLSTDYDTRPPNVIVARGEAQDGTAPVQAVAIDSDPSSPTYAGTGPGTSPYGRVTEYFSSPLLKTVPQAQAAANTILSQNVGAGATYTLVRPYDPTISAGDVVALGGAILAVDAITLDLAGDTTLQVREL
ncbi:tail protein [Actinoplanes phage phiAsp2]|uniref:Pas30 n=1 Tax=Actinoplanes phage phiAsp2 TaxID=279303 RepID=Q6J801_9CAUD|nr:tail protein [Actinoplanes phage phiAsp2]AAT36778.1 Pas30 [Actinoplanes phage phiAsp2]